MKSGKNMIFISFFKYTKKILNLKNYKTYQIYQKKNVKFICEKSGRNAYRTF